MQARHKGKDVDLVLALEDIFSSEVLKLPGKVFSRIVGTSLLEVFDPAVNTTRISDAVKARLSSLDIILRIGYESPLGKGTIDIIPSTDTVPGTRLILKDLTEIQAERLRASLPFLIAKYSSSELPLTEELVAEPTHL